MDGEPGDFTVSEGHGHPLVKLEFFWNVVCIAMDNKPTHQKFSNE
jgi:hypothetical protein